MQYTEFLRLEKLKRMLDLIAYASLAIDIAIAVVTLISLNLYSMELGTIQLYLNLALTVEVIVTLILIAAILIIRHYEKMIDHLAQFSNLLTGKTGRRVVRRRQRRLT